MQITETVPCVPVMDGICMRMKGSLVLAGMTGMLTGRQVRLLKTGVVAAMITCRMFGVCRMTGGMLVAMAESGRQIARKGRRIDRGCGVEDCNCLV